MWIKLAKGNDGQQIPERLFEGPIIKVGREYPNSDCQLLFEQAKWPMVSRKHAEFHLADGHCLLMDANSAFGTFLNGNLLEGPMEVSVGDQVQFGADGPLILVEEIVQGHVVSANNINNENLHDEIGKRREVAEDISTGPLASGNSEPGANIVPSTCASATQPSQAIAGKSLQAQAVEGQMPVLEERAVNLVGNEEGCKAKEIEGDIEQITTSLDATAPPFARAETTAMNTARRLDLFYELPLQFGGETNLNSLLQLIVDRVVDVIPEAKRGALLVRDHKTGKLALKAHLPVGNPAVSMTIARLAMEQCKAFVWPPPADEETDIPGSVVEYKIESAMYAPLLWNGKSLGVVCVDNCENSSAFKTDDLRLLQAVAHHAAMAVANLQLQEDWRCQAEIQSNILKLVSPQLAERLKQQRGRLRLGGEFRDATILISDIRGFTNLSATMSPQDVTEMIEDYFSRLVPIVFKYNGTIDKFVGDAILAVFGSPNPDDQQHLHAVQAGLEMQVAMSEVNERRINEKKRTGELGVGVHCGEVVHGFIGTIERMEFTVIGDAVNRASRYCDGARGGEMLISPEVHQWIWNFVEAEKTNITTKHEGNFNAYRIKRLKMQK
jgi:adenylate cyclase